MGWTPSRGYPVPDTDAEEPRPGLQAAGLDLAALPEPVRRRVLGLAAAALAALSDAEVPAPLRRLRTFTPAKRVRLGAEPLTAALTGQPAFRVAVGGWLRRSRPGLVEQVSRPPGGSVTPELAAVAVLLADDRAPELVRLVPVPAAAAAGTGSAAAQDPRHRKLSTELSRAERQAAESRETAERATREAERARARLRETEQTSRRVGAQQAAELRTARDELAAAQTELGQLRGELRGLRLELASLQGARASGRRTDRDERHHDELRLRILLDVLTAAATGLGRELALPPVSGRPADAVAAAYAPALDPFAGIPDRMLDVAEIGLVDRLLGVGGVHLLVDGYNVTKSGYPTLSLEEQRGRLLTGLSALAARTHAEVTCVFDAAERSSGAAVTAPRAAGVRVLFSPPGVIADEVLVRLVAAEPAGRPLLVATSDREVADAVRSGGARVLPSTALLARLSRG
jgi:predicted RNA-binding protein with PIN domain